MCSPLSLKLAVEDKDTFKKKGDLTDLFSSVEILYLAQQNELVYQNLDFLDDILGFVNLMPKSNTNIKDITRLSPVFQAGYLKENRQTIAVSSFRSKVFESVVTKHLSNPLGLIGVNEEHEGVVHEVANTTKIEFKLVEPNGDLDILDSKFALFSKTVKF